MDSRIGGHTLPQSEGDTGDLLEVGDCFLCEPDEALIYWRQAPLIAMAGLGPVVNGYSVLAHERHIRSMADLPDRDLEYMTVFVARLRRELAERFGSCVITEHGRLPVCISDHEDTHDTHCYHAHFLAFPGASNPVSYVRSYFRAATEFLTMETALGHVQGDREYFLFSPSEGSFFIMTGGLNVPRQFARLVIAISAGRPESANWRRNPNRDDALKIATELREQFAGPLSDD